MATYLVKTDQGEFEIETEDPAQDSPDFMEPGAEKSFAEQAVDAITPEVQSPPEGEGLLSRLGRATRQMFFPKNFDEVKGLINPNAGQYGVSRLLEEEGKRLGGAVRSSAQNTAEELATSQFGQQNPNIAAGLGAVYSTVADVASDSLTPSAMQQAIGGEGMGLAGQAGLNAVAKSARTLAQNAGRRGLGFIKSELKKTRGGVERANAVAQEMLDKKVITPLASAEDMSASASVLAKAGKDDALEVIRTLDASDVKPSIDADSLATKVEEQLYGAVGKNAPPADLSAIKEIRARIAGYGKESPSTFNYATLQDNPPPPATFTYGDIQKLKEVLQEPSKAKWTSQADNVKAELYRKASGIVNAELRKAIGEGARALPNGRDLLDKYLTGNLSSGKASDAARALKDRVAADAGNRFIDPFTGAVGLGGAAYSLYQQDPGAAAATLAAVGLRKFGKNYGAQITASAADKLAKEGGRLIASRPGFLATLQAAARRSLEEDRKAPPRQSKDDFSVPSLLSPRKGREAMAQEFAPKAPSPLPPLSQDMDAMRKGVQAFVNKDLKGAKKWWERAVKLNPDNYEAKRGLERLRMKQRGDKKR